MDAEKVSDWLGEQADAMVALQSELTARPAIGPGNGGAGEWERARFLEGYLRRSGFDQIEHYDCPDERVAEGSRPNFVLTVPGRHETPRIWVLTHLDVVPPGEQQPDGSWKGWESDPYKVRRAGDFIVGRGVADDQQPMVSAIFALRALMENGARPTHTVKLLFVSDEETNSDYGLRYLLREHLSMFAPEDAIIVPDAGSENSTMIEVAEKSMLWLEFHVHGKQGHGSSPAEIVNAFRAASYLVCALDETLKRQFDRVDHLFDPPGSTFEPTLHQSNVLNVNTVPGEDVFCFDCRVLPGHDLDAVIDFALTQCRLVDRRLGTTTEIKVLARQDAPPATRPDAPVVKLLEPAIEAVYRVTPRTMGIGGQTVASPFRERGLPAAAWMTTLGTAHQVNETCAIPHMVGDAQVFARVFRTDF